MKLTEMQKDPFTVYILSNSRAAALIDAGLAKVAIIDPVPENDVPVTLTGLGRSATESAPIPPPAPSK
jgi:hypothetical protein